MKVAQRYCFAALPSTGSEGDRACFLRFSRVCSLLQWVVFLIRGLRRLGWRFRGQARSHRGVWGDWDLEFGPRFLRAFYYLARGEWFSVYGGIDQRICALNCPRI